MPDKMARELESRGFESFWVGEHSHVPVTRETKPLDGGELSPVYSHIMSPMVSLGAAAATTQHITLGSGVILVLEHDLIDLALQAATLDVLCKSRFLMGVGCGWLAEELATHRPDIPFKKRFSAMRERVAAMRAIWREDIVSFEGQWDKIPKSWVYPKPVGGSIPIVMGGWGPVSMAHAAEYADAWMPVDIRLCGDDGRPNVAGGLAKFRQMLAAEERRPDSVEISMYLIDFPTPQIIEGYERLGIERVVILPPPDRLSTEDDDLRLFDRLAPLIEAFPNAQS